MKPPQLPLTTLPTWVRVTEPGATSHPDWTLLLLPASIPRTRPCPFSWLGVLECRSSRPAIPSALEIGPAPVEAPAGPWDSAGGTSGLPLQPGLPCVVWGGLLWLLTSGRGVGRQAWREPCPRTKPEGWSMPVTWPSQDQLWGDRTWPCPWWPQEAAQRHLWGGWGRQQGFTFGRAGQNGKGLGERMRESDSTRSGPTRRRPRPACGRGRREEAEGHGGQPRMEARPPTTGSLA